MTPERRQELRDKIKNSSFGPTLRRLRLESELTISLIAESCGFSVGYMSDIERQKTGPLDAKSIERVAEALTRPYIQHKTAEEITMILDMAAIYTRKKCSVVYGEGSDVKRFMMALLGRKVANMTESECADVVAVLENERKPK